MLNGKVFLQNVFTSISMKKLAIYLLTIKKSREPTYIMFESIHVCHCVIKN